MPAAHPGRQDGVERRLQRKIPDRDGGHDAIAVLAGQQLHQDQNAEIERQLQQAPAQHVRHGLGVLGGEGATLEQHRYAPRRQHPAHRHRGGARRHHQHRPFQRHAARARRVAACLHVGQHRQRRAAHRHRADAQQQRQQPAGVAQRGVGIGAQVGGGVLVQRADEAHGHLADQHHAGGAHQFGPVRRLQGQPGRAQKPPSARAASQASQTVWIA